MLRKIALILSFCMTVISGLLAQPSNYWTTSFNTEASLLAGAVVGGNAEVTAIYYNPAGISDIKDSRFQINASLFNIEHKVYKNPLGQNTKMENWFFKVYPRFAAYVYPSKKVENLTYQFAIFNRNHAETSIYNRVVNNNSDLIYHNTLEQYTGLFNLKSAFNDYWGSMGVAKAFGKNWSLGLALNVSVITFNYTREASATAIPVRVSLEDSIPLFSSSWDLEERINGYNWRFIAKVGAMYKTKKFQAGINFTFPSWRILGRADINKTVSHTNIFYQNNHIPDYYFNEFITDAHFQLKDPFSVALGVKYRHQNSRSQYFFTVEYFKEIAEYVLVDATKTGGNSEKGTDFSSYIFQNRAILNFAMGYKKMLTTTVGFLAGVRSDFNPYRISHNEKYWETNSFDNLNNNLIHLTGGVKFEFQRINFVAGLQHSYGVKKSQREFIDFSNPVSYSPETRTALQGPISNQTTYSTYSLGFYFAFTVLLNKKKESIR